jgi:hypothetical protein
LTDLPFASSKAVSLFLDRAMSQQTSPKKPEDPKPRPHDPAHEETLDQTIEESFPASDPPSSIPDPDE